MLLLYHCISRGEGEAENDGQGGFEPDWKRVGMPGNQFELKMFGFLEAYNEGDQKGGLSLLKRFLKYGKIILDSLGKAVPGVEIIKEFIDAIEMGIEKAEGT